MERNYDIYDDDRLDEGARTRLEADLAYLSQPLGLPPEKTASAGKKMLKDLGKASYDIGMRAAPVAGIYALLKGGKKIMDPITKARDLNRVLEVYPQLAEQYPREEIDLAFNSLRHLNPHFSKDPLVGGTLLGQILRSRDIDNPSSLRLEPGLASGLVRDRPREDDTFQRLMTDAAAQGVSDFLSDQSTAEDRAFRVGERQAGEQFRQDMAKEDRSAKERLEILKDRFSQRRSKADAVVRDASDPFVGISTARQSGYYTD